MSGHVPYGQGGLGRALQSVVEDARRADVLLRYYCTAGRPGDGAADVVDLSRWRWVTRGVLRSAGPGWRDFAARDLFDRQVARSLGRGAALDEVDFVALDGAGLHSFAAARRRGAARVALEATTSHVDNVRRLHRRAGAGAVEPSWLTPLHVRKLRREYAAADTIGVMSSYARASFVEAGVPEHKLVRRVHPVPARYAPPVHRPPSGVFTVIYVGRLEQTKGVALLLDAFRRLRQPDLRLVLVGRFATDSFERLVTERRRADARIAVVAGDPLAHLHRADLFVHPSFEDALAFAPLEALAAGVPVVVTEDTGMKEYVREGVNGTVVPTGDVEAIAEAMAEAIEHPIAGAGTRSLLPAALQSPL